MTFRNWRCTPTFEEVAFLLIHGDLPAQSDLKDYTKKLKSLRGHSSESQGRTGAHTCSGPILWMCWRTACSMLGCVLPEKMTEIFRERVTSSTG